MGIGRILVIAGSDSSGGAGLEADQKVIAAHGCYAMTATTALTAQNTLGVHDIHEIPSDFVTKQIVCNLQDIGADVVKIGMLASSTTIIAVAKTLKTIPVRYIVLDPVMVATSGAKLLPYDAVDSLVKDLCPLTTIITPNIPEAKLLLEMSGFVVGRISGQDDIKALAQDLLSLGPQYVFLKGGHSPLNVSGKVAEQNESKAKVINVFASKTQQEIIESPFQDSRNTHGTGCSLASAIASNLAKGQDMNLAVRAATRYVEAGIKLSQGLGNGNGPINHFHSNFMLPFAPDRFFEYLFDREDVKTVWRSYTEHDFIRGIADGSLPKENFQYYLIQDYLFLTQFARVYALAGSKAANMEDILVQVRNAQELQEEMRLHLEYCSEFGLSKKDIELQDEAVVCTSYTRYVLDIGQSRSWLELQFALSPCFLGYSEIARRLLGESNTVKVGNPYYRWIEKYASDDFRKTVDSTAELIERSVVKESLSSLEQCISTFVKATKLEAAFWDMGISSKFVEQRAHS